MRIFFFVMAALITGASAAGAQNPDPRLIESCKLIKDDTARLQCFDRESCKLIKDDKARLRCFDRSFSAAKSEGMPTPINSAPGAKSNVIPTSVGPAASSESEASAAPSSPVPGFKPEAPDPAASATPSFQERLAPVIGDLGNTSLIGRIFNSGGAKAPTWQIKADKASLNEASQVWGTLDSADGKSILALRCKDNNAEAAVSTRHFLGWDKLRVLYRINDGQPTEGYWAPTDGKSAAVSAHEAIAFINALSDNGDLLLRVFDYDGTAHDAKFGLGAVSDLRARIAIVCKWPTATATGNLTGPQTSSQAPAPGAIRPVGAPLQLN
jgi:hypothetical protein